ncbi:hypothetical protein M422DRAFT_97560, partial [Sphaerobolus stellatus SS14]
EHTVFEGELAGAILILDIIQKTPRLKKVALLLDNQAAITSMRDICSKSGRWLAGIFREHLQQLLRKKRHICLDIVWVPDHVVV